MVSIGAGLNEAGVVNLDNLVNLPSPLFSPSVQECTLPPPSPSLTSSKTFKNRVSPNVEQLIRFDTGQIYSIFQILLLFIEG